MLALQPTESNKFIFQELSLDVKSYDGITMVNLTDRSDISNNLVRKANGVIFDPNNNVICGCPSVSVDVTLEQFKEYVESGDYRVYNLIEGTIIRRFYYNGEWRLATNKNTNAFYSNWSSGESYGDLFTSLFDRHSDFCDTNKTYMFVLHHPNNFLPIKTPTPYYFHIGEIDNVNNPFVMNYSTVDLASVDADILSTIDNVYHNYSSKGFVAVHSVTGESFKLETKWYSTIKSILNGCRSPIGVYAKHYHDRQIMAWFESFFGITSYTCERKILDLSKQLLNIYRNKFIYKKSSIFYNQSFAMPLFFLHSRFKETKVPVTFQDAKDNIIKWFPF